MEKAFEKLKQFKPELAKLIGEPETWRELLLKLIEHESRDFNEIEPKVKQAKLALIVAKLNYEEFNKSR